MFRLLALGLFFLLLPNVCLAQMPKRIRDLIDKNLVGYWNSEIIFDGQVTKGTVRNRWSESGHTLIGESTEKRPEGPVQISSLLGWHSDSNSVVEKGFASDGNYWTITWNKIEDAEWHGQGEGMYLGKEWKSETHIRFDGKSTRYEDTTQGKPFVIESTRAEPPTRTVPEKYLELFDKLAGNWTIDSSSGGKRIAESFSSTFAPHREGLIWHWSGTDVDSGQVAHSTGILGWDGQQDRVVEHMVSSNGVTFDATWSGGGNRWVSPIRSMEFVDGEFKASYGERVIEFDGDDSFVIVHKNRLLDGNPQPDLRSVFTRVPDSSKGQ